VNLETLLPADWSASRMRTVEGRLQL